MTFKRTTILSLGRKVQGRPGKLSKHCARNKTLQHVLSMLNDNMRRENSCKKMYGEKLVLRVFLRDNRCYGKLATESK